MASTLADLLAEPAFGLRLRVGPADADAMKTPVAWVHSSDLADPTPWLEPGQLLLTDGAQFLPPGTDADRYIGSLTEAGVVALGFATEVLHPTIPAAVLAACERRGLPLFEVPGSTPFIGIVRHVADQIATEGRVQLEWTLQAHRALARAALRPDGLEAVLVELERQLDCWVALYDAAGGQIPVKTSRPIPARALPVVAEAVRTVLARGARASLRIEDARSGIEGTDITVQTLGQRYRLRGALVVGAATRLDPAGSDLVGSVIALASIALDQTRRLDTARRRLRTGLLELLLSGEASVAHRTAEQLWGPLPRAPLHVVLLADPPTDLVVATLEQYIAGRPSHVFFAERERRLYLIITGGRLDTVLGLLTSDLGVSGVGPGTGVSSSIEWPELSRGVEEARRALGFSTAARPTIRFADLASEGLFGYLEVSGGHAVAERVLAPLLQRPLDERTVLLDTARVWIDHNCAWQPAAEQLGVHRHTLRNRIDQIEHIVGLDLTGFAGRAELWAALNLVRSEVSPFTDDHR